MKKKKKNIRKVFKNRINFENILTYYEIAAFYKSPNLTKDFLCYIERFFTVIAETEKYLQLSFAVVSKILSSSSLHITSELEVLNAVGAWLNHNFDERKIFASNLLLKVRFCLLSENSLKCFLRERLALKRDNTCVILVQKMLKGEIKCNQSNLDTRYRYCNQNMFGIHICGGGSIVRCSRNVREIDGRNLKTFKSKLFQLQSRRAYFKAVYLKGEIYVLYGENESKPVTSVDKYSLLTKS